MVYSTHLAHLGGARLYVPGWMLAGLCGGGVQAGCTPGVDGCVICASWGRCRLGHLCQPGRCAGCVICARMGVMPGGDAPAQPALVIRTGIGWVPTTTGSAPAGNPDPRPENHPFLPGPLHMCSASETKKTARRVWGLPPLESLRKLWAEWGIKPLPSTKVNLVQGDSNHRCPAVVQRDSNRRFPPVAQGYSNLHWPPVIQGDSKNCCPRI